MLRTEAKRTRSLYSKCLEAKGMTEQVVDEGIESGVDEGLDNGVDDGAGEGTDEGTSVEL